MLHLIASSCRLVELDQLFLIPLGGDEESETFKGNWQGLCVYEVAYAVFRGQSAVTTKRHSETIAVFRDRDFPNFYQHLLSFWREANFSVIQILE